MLAYALTGSVLGVDAYLVRVEVDLARGLPSISVVGLPQSAVREGRERVTAALQNGGFELPPRRITINLAPADVRKEGSAFDLPIAVGLLAASGVLPPEAVAGTCLTGELGLGGELRPVRGVLSLSLRCAQERVRSMIVPAGNGAEAAVVEDVEVAEARTLRDVVAHLRGERRLARTAPGVGSAPPRDGTQPDLSEVRGQGAARRALEVAAAGAHNLLFVGPPGAGKSMLARRLPGILPELTIGEALEATRVHSVAGHLLPGVALLRRRPFRSPHHSVSDAGLIGGGSIPRPGEASLAHHGVLFLDELPEFRRHVLESLRQPLEDGVVHLGRAQMAVTFPARFMLVGAMNPCPCGFHGDAEGRCICHSGQVLRYLSRISGPLLDRIDLHVELPALAPAELQRKRAGESSAAVAARVRTARDVQTRRFDGRDDVHANAQMTSRDVRTYCAVDRGGARMLRGAMERLGLSARAYHRVLRIARTIADLAGEDRILASQVAEAIQYRALDRRPWHASLKSASGHGHRVHDRTQHAGSG